MATVKPIHGMLRNSYNMQKIENITNVIDKTILKFNLSLKKTYPKKTLIIGIIKYPKLAFII